MQCNNTKPTRTEEENNVTFAQSFLTWTRDKSLLKSWKMQQKSRVDTMPSQQQQLNGNKNKQPRRMASKMRSQQQVQAANE